MARPHRWRAAPLAAGLLLLAGGCARHAAAADPDAPPAPRDAAEFAMQCARSTAQSAGFTVRMRDPRNPWVLFAESTISAPPDRLVVRVIPGNGPEVPAVVRATAEGPRAGLLAGAEARETARSIEARCGPALPSPS